MAWQSDDEHDEKPWPTASARLNWARNNYAKYDLEWLVKRRLILLMNLIALDALIKVMKGESTLSERQMTEWVSLYETFRPTKPIGRPRSTSATGRTP